MKKKLSYALKSISWLYTLYFYVFSTFLKLWGVFIRQDNTLILFNCYGGKKYDDSPRAIYEEMREDLRFRGYRMVWALQEPLSADISSDIEVVKSDTLRFFYLALKAKVWITNSSMERGLDFKKKKTICLNTWHGTAIKKMGIDINSDNHFFRGNVNVRADVMLAQSQYDIDVFSHAFELQQDIFRCVGLPRNDILANYSEQYRAQIRNSLGISCEKKVLLYAPTFRDYEKGSNNEMVIHIPINLKKWQRLLGEQFVILFRAHYEVARHMKLEGYSLFVDVSDYPSLNELMIASDALISDYSSIYFDYAIMHKPIFCYAYDYDRYVEKRGIYLNLEEELPCAIHSTEESLLKEIIGYTVEEWKGNDKLVSFQKKYVKEYGNASKNVCDIVLEKLNH